MVVLRLKRMGRTHRPFYRLNAMDRRSPRDGRVIEELGWFRSLTRWPVAWSALHGIAEVRTPVLKLATNTDPTAERLDVRLHSDQAVERAAAGVTFPYVRQSP